MTETNISLTKEVLIEIFSNMKTIKEKLGKLAVLTLEERKSLLKVGESSTTFISKAAEIISHDKSFLPPVFNIDEFKKDIETLANFGELLKQYEIILQQISDTHLIISDSCYKKALDIYKYAKMDNSDGKHDVIVDSMAVHFNKQSKKKTDPKKPKTKSDKSKESVKTEETVTK